MTLNLNRPTDEQLRSAADRIRRLSAGISDPDEESAELSPFAEEALRRAYRIKQLGIDFWASLLRLDLGRRLEGEPDPKPDGPTAEPWVVGRALGATIRGQGDLKNAKRGRLWFDSSPLLGPREDGVEKPEGLSPVPRLLTVSAARKVMEIFDIDRDNDRAEELFWLGLWSGALERELRNPQARSIEGRQTEDRSVIAFLLEREPTTTPALPGGSLPDLLEASRTSSITLSNRLFNLINAQGGRDVPWRPLYSFLRRGDVVVVTLADEGLVADRAGGNANDPSDREGEDSGGLTVDPGKWGAWGYGWEDGVPVALAVVTAPTNWDRAGWWGRIGSVIMLGDPRGVGGSAYDSAGLEGDPVRDAPTGTIEKLRTAFRFPDRDEEKGRDLKLSFGLMQPDEGNEKDSRHASFKTTNDLALERISRYEEWLDEGRSRRDGSFNPELIQPIPSGFPGPWRKVDRTDLRATLGEFLDFHSQAVAAFEVRNWPSGAAYDNEAGYQANLDIERFALTSDNVRLGVFFDNPVRSNGRASAQRIAPDPLPDLAMLTGGEKGDGLTAKERGRIDAANLHRRMFDLYKRGLGDDFSKSDQNRAAAYMPAIRLDPSIVSGKDVSDFEVFLNDGNGALWSDRTSRIWEYTFRESEWEKEREKRLDPVNAFVDSVGELLTSPAESTTFCAVFPESEREDLDRATFSRAFRRKDLAAEDGLIPIDPAGTRMRPCVLITSEKSKSRLLIVLTDDSVAAVDLGAIVWLLLAYDELEKEHVLDVDAHALFLEDSTTDPKAKRRLDFREIAERRQKEAWETLCRSRPKKWSK